MAVVPFDFGAGALFAVAGSCATLAGFAVARRDRRPAIQPASLVPLSGPGSVRAGSVASFE
eukprot:11039324-Heterocapsa_arctica.AAC.1